MPLWRRVVSSGFWAIVTIVEPLLGALHAVPCAEMQVVGPAQLKSGISVDDFPHVDHATRARGSRKIRGKALIFWDPKLPGTRFGRKLDAIDTDQITPASDCVSESLETLDERWKA